MSEDFNPVEAELARMRPRRLSPDLHDRIAAPLSIPPRRSWSDRLLICAIASGSIAACLSLLLLLGDPPSPALPSSVMATVPTPRAGDLAVAATQHNDQLASAWK